MALIDIRTLFIRDFTGRYDLVQEGTLFEDNGADFYINAGQRWLDRKVGHKKSPASINVTIETGGFYVSFLDARAIQEIWASNDEGCRWELRKKERREIRCMYPSTYELTGNGPPRYYTPINFRTLPFDGLNFTIDKIGDDTYISNVGSDYAYNGALILPPTDMRVNIEIIGLFYSPKLVSDADRNFWTEQEPFLLINAACRMIEASMRNQQGVADYEKVIGDSLIDIDMDAVEEEVVAIQTMGNK